MKGDPQWSSSQIYAGDEPPLKQWLGKQLVENKKRSFEPDSFGYEYEEADLEFEQIKELEAETRAQDDEDVDFESLRGHAISIWDAFVGKPSSDVTDDEVRALLTKQDLYKIPSRSRGSVYNYLQRQAKDQIRQFIRNQAVLYNKEVVKFRAGGWERDAILLRQLGIKLIGEALILPLNKAVADTIDFRHDYDWVEQVQAACCCSFTKDRGYRGAFSFQCAPASVLRACRQSGANSHFL
jgi:hypothetical protein